jgi:phenylacetate-CoA ligase
MALPLLFLFGRADSTISYMGANLYPQDVEYGLYEGNPYAAQISRFCMSLEEQPDLEARPVINIELRADVRVDERAVALLAAACRHGVVDHLASVSRDFAASLKEDPAAGDLRVRVFAENEGPFAGASRLKNTYLVRDTVRKEAV